MAKLSKLDIKDLTLKELQDKIASEKIHYRKTKFNHAVTPLDNPLALRLLRRNNARLITELKLREIKEKSK